MHPSIQLQLGRERVANRVRYAEHQRAARTVRSSRRRFRLALPWFVSRRPAAAT